MHYIFVSSSPFTDKISSIDFSNVNEDLVSSYLPIVIITYLFTYLKRCFSMPFSEEGGIEQSHNLSVGRCKHFLILTISFVLIFFQEKEDSFRVKLFKSFFEEALARILLKENSQCAFLLKYLYLKKIKCTLFCFYFFMPIFIVHFSKWLMFYLTQIIFKEIARCAAQKCVLNINVKTVQLRINHYNIHLNVLYNSCVV